jgi:NarL family two-component system response regulator LiaR
VPPIRVLLADDHPVVLQGLKTFLDLQDDLQVVGEARNGDEAIEAAERLRPDVVLLDLVMPRGGGLRAIRRILEASPQSRVVILTSFVDEDSVVPAVEAGASGYLLKDLAPAELAEAIRTAHRGEAVLHPGAAARLVREVAGPVRPAAPGALTPREIEVLRAIAGGMSNREIARALVLSEKTVKTHVSSILSKLGVADRTQAALHAVRSGLVDLQT